jgi:hypothetical protein
MDRRRALRLFASAIGVSVSSQAHAFADPERCPEHVGWDDIITALSHPYLAFPVYD